MSVNSTTNEVEMVIRRGDRTFTVSERIDGDDVLTDHEFHEMVYRTSRAAGSMLPNGTHGQDSQNGNVAPLR